MSKKQKNKPLASEALLGAIKASGVSLYRVAKDAGVGYASLYRFVHGERAVSLDVFDRLCETLQLELRPKKP